MPGRRIVVGMDGSRASKEALRWSADEALCRGAIVEAVMAWDDPYRDMWLPSDPPGTDRLGHVRAALGRTVATVLGEDPEVTVELTVSEGHPAQVLIDRAQGADMLVVGNRGRGGIAGALLGSVSFNCAAHGPCPVVVVHEAAGADTARPR